MSDLVFTIDVRERTGTGGARATRRDGQVPGVLYGGPLGPVAIALSLNEVKKGLNQGGFLSRLIEIDHNGVKQPVVVRDMQFHPVTATPIHIDLFRVESDQELTIEIPVKFFNEETSPGLKRGGALNVVRHTIEIVCTPDRIPAEVAIDLADLEINDSVHISSVTLPEGVRPAIQDRDFTIATIVGRGGSTKEGDEAEASEEEAPPEES